MINNKASNLEKTNVVELSDVIDNQYLRMLLDNKIIKFFSKNTSTTLAIATVLITIGSFFIKVLSYMWLRGYLSVFLISIDSIGYSSNHGFMEFLTNAVVFTGLAIAVSMAYVLIDFFVQRHQLKKIKSSITKVTFSQKLKGIWFDIKNSTLIFLAALIIIELINILLVIFMGSRKPFFAYTINELLIALVSFTIIETITAAIILSAYNTKNKKQIKDKKTANLTNMKTEEIKKKVPKQKNIFINIITSSVVLLFFLYSTYTYFSGVVAAQQKISFSIIEGEYAVVYQDQQHYWVIASQEKSVDSLILNTTSQKILDINNIELKIKSYKEIVILYK